MNNKIKTITLAGFVLLGMTSCSDYLDTSSPSTADADFVFSNSTTAQAALDGAYIFWHDALLNNVFCNAEFYGLDAAGSDIEKNPESFASQSRHIPLSFYQGGTQASTFEVTSWNKANADAYSRLYTAIGGANNIIFAMENSESWSEIESGSNAALAQIYGEAICIKASAYRDLIRYYGDVPYQKEEGGDATGFTSRSYIYGELISKLESVASKMTKVKSGSKNKFSSTYAYALLGRLCLETAGYQLYRDDVAQVTETGASVSIIEDQEDNVGWQYTDFSGVKYGRRADYATYLAKAEKAYKACLANLGDAKFNSTDYSEFFTQIHGTYNNAFDDNKYADESIFEEPLTQGGSENCERPYAFGRPAASTGSNGFPCKSYGQTRINPAFYYGKFDPKDIRRDLCVAVTVSDTKGFETLTSMTPGNCLNGGLACNKFDENRQKTVWTAKQRKSGMNMPFMRVSHVYLGLAEVLAAEGKNQEAATYYNYTHVRAGLSPASTVTVEEVIDERGFEFAAEGDRRWALIRTGLIGKKISEIKALTAKMILGLQNQGYYHFDNGNEISNYVYTKAVAPGTLGATTRLVGQSAVHDGGYEPSTELEAMTFPGWRGQHDWHLDGVVGSKKVAYYGKTINDGASNLCIRGLFKHLDAAPAGYTVTPWAIYIIGIDGDEEHPDYTKEYLDYQFRDWNYHSAPIYLVPFNENECTSASITNGYSFKKY